MIRILPPKSSYYLRTNSTPIASNFLHQITFPAHIAHAGHRRQQEYLQGRYCAYLALTQLTSFKHSMGVDPGLIVATNQHTGAPVWPWPFCGSISHSTQTTIAIAGNNQDFCNIGIDLESIGRITRQLWRKIMVPGEESLLIESSLSEEEFATLVFSAKESLFKAIFPLEQTFFSFQQAKCREISLSNQSIILEYNRKHYRGRFQLLESELLTVVVIDPSS